ncbi:hypothetical protein [Intestinibacter sp.]|uniref:hypothetical protein n=1 Tax=Intestinibacter sp. TaxID=1965304 RepID=UPI003F183DC9
MIKYYTVDKLSYLVKINSEIDILEGVGYITSNIDWVYRIPEDGVLVSNTGTEKVKAGDIVFKMYSIEDKCSSDRELIVIKDEKLIDYYSRLHQHLASKQSVNKNDSECETCNRVSA